MTKQNFINQSILWKIENSSGPTFTYSVTRNSNLKLETYLFEQDFFKVDKFKSQFILNYINILTGLFEEMNRITVNKTNESTHKQIYKRSISHICN